MMMDRFGREISTSGTHYSCEGIEVEAHSDVQALNTFNAMAPEGWVELCGEGE